MSRFLKMFTATATVALVLIASIQAPTLAFTVDESVIASGGDASDVYTSAPDVTNTIDTQTVIKGQFDYRASDTTPDQAADIYKIFLSAGTFQVTVAGDNQLKTILALFNSDGKGVYIAGSDTTTDAKVDASIDKAGVYYLGISVNTVNASNVSGVLITVPSTLNDGTTSGGGGDTVFPNIPFNNFQQPTSNVQGGYRFDGISFPGQVQGTTNYTATLTGTAVNVPEPAMAGTSFGFLALALTTGIGRRLRLTEKSGFKN
jgi:hypothetical protein